MSNFRTQIECHLVILLWLVFAWNAWAADIGAIDALVGEVDVARVAMKSIQDNANAGEAEQIGTRKRYDVSVVELDRTRAETLEELTGASEASISQQRQRGQSWREIADELNIHPSFIGIEIIDSRPPSFVPSFNN
ncbi:MAG: hypothetical protein ACI915_004705 [Gammaproteobacteria bacterium]|jgi:hypothetical protein